MLCSKMRLFGLISDTVLWPWYMRLKVSKEACSQQQRPLFNSDPSFSSSTATARLHQSLETLALGVNIDKMEFVSDND